MDGEVGFDQPARASGSTFWFEIAAPLAGPRGEAGRTTPLEAWLEGLRVLVVEDNPTNRLIATKMLENLGATVETADDGEQGVEAARPGAFDLIFMDVQMPVMDGITATRGDPRPGRPRRPDTPIVAMTANAMAHQQESYRAAGMNGAVSKPLSPASPAGRDRPAPVGRERPCGTTHPRRWPDRRSPHRSVDQVPNKCSGGLPSVRCGLDNTVRAKKALQPPGLISGATSFSLPRGSAPAARQGPQERI